ncbi:flagellar biosynthesis anti-sigma factor FlgM [bacterium]|jgi:hypothetical protein|nr:flagellar biosynthesis anti-sigma factor FlgM [bacterium]
MKSKVVTAKTESKSTKNVINGDEAFAVPYADTKSAELNTPLPKDVRDEWQEMPSIRVNLVEKFRNQYEEGTYLINDEKLDKVADGLLSEDADTRLELFQNS